MFAIRYLVAVAALLSAESVVAQNMCDGNQITSKFASPSVLAVVATSGPKCLSNSGIDLSSGSGVINTPGNLAKLCSVPECVQILDALRSANPTDCTLQSCSSSTSGSTGSTMGSMMGSMGSSGQSSTTGGTGTMGSLTGSRIGAGSQHVGGTGSMTAPENSSLPNPAQSGSNGGTGGSGGNGATALAATSTVAAVATVAVLML